MKLYISFSVILAVFLFNATAINAKTLTQESKNPCPNKEKFCIIAKQTKAQQNEIIAINNSPYIISFYINITGNNISSKVKFPKVLTIKANKQNSIAILRSKDPQKNSLFKFQYSWVYGDYFLKPRNFSYRLPYKKHSSYLVGQGFDTKATHSGLNKYAIDWNMDENTEIYAARSGYVIEIEQSHKDSGTSKEYLDKANYIKIMHKDGSVGVYAHLAYQGVKVKLNSYIYQGDFLGYSGNTGFSTGAHLHFHVAKAEIKGNIMTERTIAIRFSNCNNINFIPQEGKKYKSC